MRIFSAMKDTERAAQRRIYSVATKITEEESRAWDALKKKLGGPHQPMTDANALRYAMALGCQAENIDWPAVES